MSKTVKNIFFVLLAVCIVAVVVFLVIKYTNITDEFDNLFDNSFRVSYNGKEYRGENNEITLDGKAKFTVKGDFKSYTVEIKPNVTDKTDFEFTVEGNTYKYSSTNLTPAFLSSDNVSSKGFTFNSTDYSLDGVLSKLVGSEVKTNASIENPFLLVVTSDSGDVVSFVFGDSSNGGSGSNGGDSSNVGDDPNVDGSLILNPDSIIF